MTDSAREDFDRRLFVQVRHERPSRALRERIVAEARRRRARAPVTRAVAFGTAGLLLCAAGVVGVFIPSRDERRVEPQISAEHSPSLMEVSTESRQVEEKRAPTLSLPEERVAPAGDLMAESPAATGALDETVGQPKTAPGPSQLPDSEPPPSEPSLGERLKELKRARAALRAGDPLAALAMLKAYRASMPGDELAAEASLLQIEALSAAGKSDEAAGEARRFVAEHPTSPLIDRARSFEKP